ncbi:phosphomevalonate kinase [Eurytemora carolleeae]|uniref:phosphomevalonate kinase n=1 Tax=Eurytemora carolleeae TaxID=1294199 RepID=UPI000C7719AD|nr:phosphomevalonate kinase [Eurytemora carolleeae]|eukprot:XP_023340670.1 phosphomevalonate kinase-like [Eurytemora affinis]
MSELPKLILIFSGKRKSGKDYITDLLQEKLGDIAVIIRLSGPLKQCFATTHGLDYEQLLSAGEYKEKYRVAMLEWSEAIRREDYTYFCKAAISKYSAEKFPVWIISDARRLTDLQFFRYLDTVEEWNEWNFRWFYRFKLFIDSVQNFRKMDNPSLVFMLSGKRKSGKDFLADYLKDRIGDRAIIIRIAAPIKLSYANHLKLDFKRLLSSDSYKEDIRIEMLEYQNKIMAKDGAFFCREAIRMYSAYQFPIWIVSDLRRRQELNFFREMFKEKVVTIRIHASDITRINRGWIRTHGVNDSPSECALDSETTWNYRITNNGAEEDGRDQLEPLLNLAKENACD